MHDAQNFVTGKTHEEQNFVIIKTHDAQNSIDWIMHDAQNFTIMSKESMSCPPGLDGVGSFSKQLLP